MPSRRYGYSCRPWIKGYVEGQCFDTVLLWFTLEENAAGNAASSNPHALCEEWKKIVRQEDHGHPLVIEMRNKLQKLLARRSPPPAIKRALRQQIRHSSIGIFYPQRLQIDLGWIALLRGCSVQDLLNQCRAAAGAAVRDLRSPQVLQPDEYLIDDLPLADLAAWCTFL